MRDARDIRSWSGILRHAKDALERHVGDVADLSPAPVPRLPLRAARAAIKALTGATYAYEHDPALSRRLGAHFTRRVREAAPDVIFAPAASSCIAHLETDVPIVYYSDATWRAMDGYYPEFSRLSARSRRGGEEAESLAIARSRLAVFASDWAADSARRDYAADPAKVHVLPFGANLADPAAIAVQTTRAPSEPWRLLFVGVFWERKGGPLAMATLDALLRRGRRVELTVVGCTPPRGTRHPAMRVIPFLNKAVPSERAMLTALWTYAHCLVLPTRQEAAGLVFCEAAAHGLPRISTRTGGVPTYVEDGVSGTLLPPDANAEQWADAVEATLGVPARYQAQAVAARAAFDTHLNWDAWGRRLHSLLNSAGI